MITLPHYPTWEESSPAEITGDDHLFIYITAHTNYQGEGYELEIFSLPDFSFGVQLHTIVAGVTLLLEAHDDLAQAYVTYRRIVADLPGSLMEMLL